MWIVPAVLRGFRLRAKRFGEIIQMSPVHTGRTHDPEALERLRDTMVRQSGNRGTGELGNR
jgi:hypothetical protein